MWRIWDAEIQESSFVPCRLSTVVMDQRSFEIELVEFMDHKVRPSDDQPFLVQDISSLDQIAAENLLFMAQEGQMEIVDLIQNVVNEEELQKQLQEDEFPSSSNEITTEEVITDDWVEQGEERVEIPVDQIITSQSNVENNEFDVPLPTQQDYYTASRPYPCDFCTRRFRKKNSLMNHMVNFHAGGAEFDTDCEYLFDILIGVQRCTFFFFLIGCVRVIH